MKTHMLRFVAASCLFMLAASLQSVHAQTTYSLVVDGIQGDSITPGAGLVVTGWTFGVENVPTLSGGGAGAGKASFEELMVTKTVDSASPLLMQACATGQHISSAVLKGKRKGASQDYLIITMSDVLITSVNLGGTSGKPAPTESVTFTYSRVEYLVRKKSGEEVKFTWNLATGTSS